MATTLVYVNRTPNEKSSFAQSTPTMLNYLYFPKCSQFWKLALCYLLYLKCSSDFISLVNIHISSFSSNIALFFLMLFIYSFLAALALHCCTQAFSSCSEQALLFIDVRRLLVTVAFLVAKRRFWARGLSICGDGLSCSAICGIFPDQESDLYPLHWQGDS